MKFKLAAQFFILVLAIVVFQFIYFPNQQLDDATDALVGKATSLCQLVAANLAPAVEFQQFDRVPAVFRGAAQDTDLAFIALFDRRGEVVESLGLERAPAQLERAWEPRDGLEVSAQDDMIIVRASLQSSEAIAPLGGARGAATTEGASAPDIGALDIGSALSAPLDGAADPAPDVPQPTPGVQALDPVAPSPSPPEPTPGVQDLAPITPAPTPGVQDLAPITPAPPPPPPPAPPSLSPGDAAAPNQPARYTLAAGFSLARIEEAHAATRWVALKLGALILALGTIVSFVVGTSWASRVGKMSGVAEQIARGRLNMRRLDDHSHDEIGRLASSFNRMIDSQRALVTQIAESAVRVDATASELLATSRQQESGATEQSSAVEQTRRTMVSLLESSREIAETSSGVVRSTDETYKNNQLIAERLVDLNRHTQRIGEILEVIKDIANKSDLLALNAALEGTKAGAVGRGFSLVANQMQRLAENVMQSATDIKALTADIRQSTDATVLATEDATRLAAEATRSAHRINLIAQQQQSGAEQVSLAMNDVHVVARQAAEAGKQTVETISELVELSGTLRELVEGFQLDAGRVADRS